MSEAGEKDLLLKNGDNPKTISIDDAIEKLGMGKFQYILLFITGLCFASDSIEISLLSFLSPTLEVNWELEPWQSSTITSVVFAGAFLGTLVFGRLGDVIGRRPSFLLGAFTISIFGIATSFANDFYSLLLIRFIVGLGVGGMIIPFDILAEFLPTSYRGRFLMRIEYFWTFGSMFVPLLAAITLKTPSSWRIFVAICAVPCFLSAIVGVLILPESPRWLIAKGRKKEAQEILERVGRMNGSPALFDSSQDFMELEDEQEEESSNFLDLLKPKWRRVTLLLWAVWLGFGITYYGAVIVIVRIFASTDDAEEQTSDLDFDFSAIFISASAEIVGTALVIFTIDRLGRGKSQTYAYLCGGCSVLVLCSLAATKVYFYNDDDDSSNSLRDFAMLVSSYITRIMEMMGSSATYVITAELLPTEIRTTGHSAANALARLGGFFAPYIVSNGLPYGAVGIILFVVHMATAYFSSCLPETMGQDMGKSVMSEDDGKQKSSASSSYQSTA